MADFLLTQSRKSLLVHNKLVSKMGMTGGDRFYLQKMNFLGLWVRFGILGRCGSLCTFDEYRWTVLSSSALRFCSE